ncbi:MAG TPA: AraD1 family protein [Caldilineaceae bacterium]|nr:AraD1 family protein [Caldilineaceae bacterium]
MRLVQFLDKAGERRVAQVSEDGATLYVLRNTTYLRDLAQEAYRRQMGLEALVRERLGDEHVSYDQVADENRLLLPLDHPDPAHCIVSGTGLDHLGSAQARDAMHAKLESAGEALTDSMRMFKLGLEGGKPPHGEIGVQPEWFYKGDGSWLVRPGEALELPEYALDGGEEPELVGLYVIADTGTVLRVGFAIGNEYSDHVLEKQNYLYLAHSKLRTSSFGPEVRIGEPPANIRGVVRILRNGGELWSGEFLTGEENMTHSMANLEHHHFKYANFRRPGDVHVHFFGTATLSYAAGILCEPGDIFEISAPGFGRPLRNPLRAVHAPAPGPVTVTVL